MTRLKIGLLLAATASLAIAAPATAQMNHANMPGMKMPMPAKKPAAKKPVAKKPVAKKAVVKAAARKPSAKKPSAKKPAAVPATAMPPGHDMSAMPAQPATPGADPMAGHDMRAMPGMDMSAMPDAASNGMSLPAGNAPPPPAPTDHAADAVYGVPAMEMGRHHLSEFHGGQKFAMLAFNLAEYQLRKGRDGYEWNGQAWYGGDIDRLWLKSEGDGEVGGRLDRAEIQALYSHAIGPYFNLQGGLRYDFKPSPSRVYATVGLEGLATNFFDVEGALFLSNKGELMARAEGYYDQRITQRLILQPRAELNFAAQNSRDIGVGAGLSDAELGLRLRYEIRREFAPYVGVQYGRAFGKTRDYQRANGEGSGSWSFVTGVRTWF
ncbi:MAG: copper resistance protein B [Sphingomicrobium sp.]